MKKITCVVENSARRGSVLWGEHGLAYHITSGDRAILFDTGQTGSLLLHNLGSLGISLADVQGLILSHAHYDHTGGVSTVLAHQPGLPTYGSPDIFRSRYAVREKGAVSIGFHLTRQEMVQMADLRLSSEPVEVIDGVWTTGEIVDRPEPEGRSRYHFVQDNDQWKPDPYRDDISVVVETERGLVVVCGCCHAGLLNTLAHVRRRFDAPIVAVMGGTHLVSADADELQHVVKELSESYGTLDFYLNHCTGERAFVALASAFGERVQPFPAGSTLASA